MTKCSACDRDVKPKDAILNCSRTTCKLQYHQACVGVKKGDSTTNWICPECKVKQTRRGDNTNTPVKETFSGSDEFINSKRGAQTSANSNSSSCYDEEKPDDIIGIIKAEIETAFKRELPNFITKLKESVANALEIRFLELEKSVKTCSDLYDSVKVKVENNSAILKKIQTENTNLDNQIKILQGKINSMEEASLKQEQWSRLQNLEIIGIPEADNENLPDMMIIMAKHLKVSLEFQDLDFVHRVQAKRPVKGKSRNIVVRFQNRSKKDAFLSAARKTGGITSEDVGLDGEPTAVYVNEHLTIKNKLLLNKCKTKAKDCNYTYVWTKIGTTLNQLRDLRATKIPWNVVKKERIAIALKEVHELASENSYCEVMSLVPKLIHERLHTGEKPYVCSECGAGFHRKSSYLQHIAIHLPEKTVQCDSCPARFKSVTLMRIHRSRHRPPARRFGCRLCGRSFARRRNVARHLTAVHATAPDPTHIHTVKI
ncbi:hypothetical protein evm_014547 [Chilo suppressalis]|nr:hypothetical protein evm_014547 [Chilo suppressalis]